ncbi:Exocyst complex component 6B-like protein [Dinothrombium tinctorium]|uniref:Exocyst complex component n=1 Tax=Dinothrombium tinctorium TaxID=1965070 RepID=A0A443RNU2_9ACAR|nr:Exocyst complex component 6B-like protein [Dinothrombium tinctorium]
MQRKSEGSVEKTLLNSGSNDYDHLLVELESTDSSSVGLVLRAIYDGDEYEKFMERLDARIKGHDKDIERMCNAHYQGFVDCIHELLQVRPQAERLKKEIIDINHDLQKSSENVQRKAEELIKFRRILCNTETAIEHLSACLPVLEMYGKLVTQMNDKKYYPALKTLELLEHTYLPRVSKYRFAQAMCTKIPMMRDRIKEASMSDLKDFLENIRKMSSKIGEIAMKNAAHQQNIEDGLSTAISSVDSSNSNSPAHSYKKYSNINGNPKQVKKRKAPMPPNPFTGEIEAEPPDVESELDATASEEELSATDLVDFSPVYRCLHIFGCLGAREQFEVYYRQQRQQQAKLALQPPINMHENIEGYKNYFCGIVGFFVIEDNILSTAQGLVTKQYLDEVWENALQSIVASLRTHTSYCTDEGLMLKIKRLVMLFSYTLQGYGYNVNALFKLLLEIRDQYNEILMKQWVSVFRTIFDADNYHPIQVNNASEYNQILAELPFFEDEVVSIGNNEFPKKFPFSSFVPKVYKEVKRFICACLQFSLDLNSSQTEIEDMVRKSTNILLTRTLSGCLSSLIKKPNLGLLQLIQITINTNYLEVASVHLEEFISQTINSPSMSTPVSTPQADATASHLALLQGKSMFKDARADAESQIYLQLNQKIDEFLELASYDWMLSEPSGMSSSYISDLIAFLKSTFQAFTNLPLKVAQTACHSACKHIASSLMNFLMDEEVKCISLGALQQFNLDLIQCELFANSEPVPGFEEGALQMCFTELRQLMDLFTIWDWSTYLSDYGKQDSKYLRVNPTIALNLLEKVKEADKKKNLFTSLKKNERDKKKLIDMVIKQLKQLVIINNAS